MREILFRGKEKYGDGWVYGFLYTEKTSAFIVEDMFCVDDMFYTGAKCKEVIPESVGQYTGLKDKNGTKIFEGDILERKADRFFRGPIYRAIIVAEEWNCGCCNDVFGFSTETAAGYPTLGLTNHDKSIVIGNIHDNPELLKERR